MNDAYDPSGSRHAKSIAFRSAAIVYEQNLFTAVEVTAADLDGAPCVVQVPLLSPAAAILSKCESVAIKRRTRDAFDIHYMLSGTNGPKAAAELRQLAADFPQVDEQLQLLRTFLVAHPDTYDRNVSNHARRGITTAAAATLEALFPG